MGTIFNDLPLTRLKILMAGCLYRMIKPFVRKNHHTIKRRGIFYEIDLIEGIDLSLFIFGAFQQHITACRLFDLPREAIILDVGANAGAISLPLADLAKNGHVYAFEPVTAMYDKLLRNISLNPALAGRVTPVKAFVSNQSRATTNHRAVYGRWRVCNGRKDRHPIHGGEKEDIAGTTQITLDDYCARINLTRVDLIKIDVEGHEFHVLQGARRILAQQRPVIIFEAGLYSMQEHGTAFPACHDFLSGLGYRLIHSKNGRPITRENYRVHIPRLSTIDIIAMPEAVHHQ